MLANTVDPDQAPYYVASDRAVHYLPMTLLWVSKWELVITVYQLILSGEGSKKLKYDRVASPVGVFIHLNHCGILNDSMMACVFKGTCGIARFSSRIFS